MITEFAIAGIGLAVFRTTEEFYKRNKWKTKSLKDDIKIFKEVCRFKENSFILIDGGITKYGSKLVVSLKNKTMKELEDMKEHLEAYYKTELDITRNDNKCTATIDIFKNKISDTHKYKPVELEPHELFISLNTKFELMVADMNEHTHVLLSGANGSGKSKLLQIIITNLIYPNKSNVELYISNKTNTPDFREFLNCHQVKGYVESMADTMLMLEHIMHIFEKRLSMINAKRCDNIRDYNKKHKDKQMSYIYLIVDEFAQYFPDDKDDPEYEYKNKGKITLKRMAEILRKTGIFLIIATQRPDTNSLSPSMKCNLRTKLGFAQENIASSLVVSDDSSLFGIPNRTFLYMFGGERVWCKSLFVTNNMIREYIKSSTRKNRRDQEDFNCFLKKQQEKEKKDVKEVKPSRGKAKAMKKEKVVDINNTTEKEVAVGKVSKVKNISCEDINGYTIDDGKICISIKRRVD